MQSRINELQEFPIEILVVEDHELMRENLCRYLKLRGYAVSWLDNVKEARTELAAGRYDLVFLDLQLPDGDGWELFEQRASNHAEAIVTMSGFDSPELAARSLRAGALAHLCKPFSPQEIETVLDAVNRVVRSTAVRLAKAHDA